MFLIYAKNLFDSLNMQHRVLGFSVKYHNYLSNTILPCFTILCINCLQERSGGVCVGGGLYGAKQRNYDN